MLLLKLSIKTCHEYYANSLKSLSTAATPFGIGNWIIGSVIAELIFFLVVVESRIYSVGTNITATLKAMVTASSFER